MTIFSLSKRVAGCLFLVGLTAACGERDYEQPKVETTVEVEPADDSGTSLNSGDALPSDETDINKLAMTFTTTVDDVKTVFEMVPVAAEGEAVLMMPRGSAYVTIPATAEDVANLTFVFVIEPGHAFPRPLSQVAATLDTYYLAEGATEEEVHTMALHGESSFTWQTVSSGFGHGYGIRASGFQAFNTDFGATRTIRNQYLTFLMTSPTAPNRALIASVPVVIGQ